VIVYREQRRRVFTAEFLHQIEDTQGFDRQMKFGQFEAGVADALCPECDRDLPVLAALRRGESDRGEWEGFELPREIEISVPEGFAYYALDPELYRRAAAVRERSGVSTNSLVMELMVAPHATGPKLSAAGYPPAMSCTAAFSPCTGSQVDR
jgi:hypothetical protein